MLSPVCCVGVFVPPLKFPKPPVVAPENEADAFVAGLLFEEPNANVPEDELGVGTGVEAGLEPKVKVLPAGWVAATADDFFPNMNEPELAAGVDDTSFGAPKFTVPVALSLLGFFAALNVNAAAGGAAGAAAGGAAGAAFLAPNVNAPGAAAGAALLVMAVGFEAPAPKLNFPPAAGACFSSGFLSLSAGVDKDFFEPNPKLTLAPDPNPDFAGAAAAAGTATVGGFLPKENPVLAGLEVLGELWVAVVPLFAPNVNAADGAFSADGFAGASPKPNVAGVVDTAGTFAASGFLSPVPEAKLNPLSLGAVDFPVAGFASAAAASASFSF